MDRVRVGVWGAGVWGEKHARVYAGLPQADLAGVFDRHPGRGAEIAARHGGTAFASAAALLDVCEAVSIAVPTVDHRAATEQALAAGCHVLVEKPMATDVAEADAMIVAAQRAGRTLQVGQVERFNPALIAARPLVRAPKFIEAHRLAAFQPRSLDIDVVLDLMIHDLDAVLHLTGQLPSAVSAVGVAVLSHTVDIANARLEFDDGCVANLTASRVSQERLRRIRFFQGDAYLSIDLFAKSGEMLRVDRAARPPIQRAALDVQDGEPLALELGAFLDAVRGRGEGAASAKAGREALRVAAEVRAAMERRALQWAAG
ncbi:MAG: Gfo/Idh/MocA family oxidoreductase [Candidatus Eisenbacteria bacterium]|uniref:Gfo/Idh/MocA family oxidoreductase n=1 Tax=Eiseniibacteriota bacterium TaxID=2212470 RepID=A0A9D6QMU1_UNCEI|nr:Gfo/Idh/MocA family oxidoreductase [Candidatus Eisenbacteria bacterium]MBI3540113.1 Gfo/Idh/MocA family oxidoreductase [Candidatus Eisenbacteria bacterium]